MQIFVILIFLLSFLAALSGCFGDSSDHLARQAHAKTVEPESRRLALSTIWFRNVAVILIDRTGSISKNHGRIFADAADFIRIVGSGTRVFGRYISDKSTFDDELFLQDAIPPAPAEFECRMKNNFNYKEKQHCRTAKKQHDDRVRSVQAARARIGGAIQRLSPSIAKYTDVWGALEISSQMLNVYKRCQRIMVIYSDFDHNTKNSLAARLPGFQNAKIFIRTMGNANSIKTEKVLKYVESRLKGTGAVIISTPLVVPWSNEVLGFSG